MVSSSTPKSGGWGESDAGADDEVAIPSAMEVTPDGTHEDHNGIDQEPGVVKADIEPVSPMRQEPDPVDEPPLAGDEDNKNSEEGRASEDHPTAVEGFHQDQQESEPRDEPGGEDLDTTPKVSHDDALEIVENRDESPKSEDKDGYKMGNKSDDAHSFYKHNGAPPAYPPGSPGPPPYGGQGYMPMYGHHMYPPPYGGYPPYYHGYPPYGVYPPHYPPHMMPPYGAPGMAPDPSSPTRPSYPPMPGYAPHNYPPSSPMATGPGYPGGMHDAPHGGPSSDPFDEHKENADDDQDNDASAEDAAAGARLKIYIKPNVPASQEVLDRRARKNGQSRARAARQRERVAQIEQKPESERTPEEQHLFELHQMRRKKKNDRSRDRAVEKKEEIDRILAKPESSRTRIEKQFLEQALGAKKRKNEGDRLRRSRLKAMGMTGKNVGRPGIPARGPMPAHAGMSHPHYGMPPPGYYPHHPSPHGHHMGAHHPPPHYGSPQGPPPPNSEPGPGDPLSPTPGPSMAFPL